MTYKVLLTCGCSVTFGNELSDIGDNKEKPSDLAWPALLAKYLKIPNVINTAESASGNDFIKRKTIKSIDEVLKIYKSEEILVGIMLTQLYRFEIPIKKGKENYKWSKIGVWSAETNLKDKGDNWFKKRTHVDIKETNSWIEDYLIYGQSEYYDAYRTLDIIHHLQLYLKNNNIDVFFMFSNRDKFLTTDNKPIYKLSINDDNLNHFKYLIDWEQFYFMNEKYDGFQNWATQNKYPIGKKGHFLDDAHKDFVQQKLGYWVKKKYEF